jgi:hypothetical protein
MLNSPKKYRGIKFLNVEQKFLNVKVLNKNKAKKSLSINTPILSNKMTEKSLKSSINDYPYKSEEEISPIFRNDSIKKRSKRRNTIEIKDSNIYKIIKKKNIEEKNVRAISPYKIIKVNPRRIHSLKKITSCKNMYLRNSLFNNKNKIIVYNSSKKPNSNNDFNNFRSINEKSKKKNKSKSKKTINLNNNNNQINKKDSENIIQLKAVKITKNEDNKDNKDENKINKNIKKFFCCL